MIYKGNRYNDVVNGVLTCADIKKQQQQQQKNQIPGGGGETRGGGGYYSFPTRVFDAYIPLLCTM